MRLCAYTRRSTDAQAVSPQAQEREIREFCAAQGHELVRVYHEVPISASKKSIEHRTVLPVLLVEVRDKRRDFDGIIVWKYDRAFRQEDEYHIVAAILRKHKCRLLSVKDPVSDDDTAASRFTASILVAAAAYESSLIGERIFAHHMTVFLSGRWPGGNVPMGFTYDSETKLLAPNERVDDVITVFEVYARSAGNGMQTTAILNRLGIPAPKGGRWLNSTVLRVVKSPFYRRRLFWNGQQLDAPDIIPEILPPELVREVDALIPAARNFHPRQRGSGHTYSGLLHCSQCDSQLVAGHSKPGGARYLNWVCKNYKFYCLCQSKHISNRYIDVLVGRAVQTLLSAMRDDLAQVRSAVADESTATNRNSSTTRQMALEEMRRRAVKLYVEGKIGEAEFNEIVQGIDAKLSMKEQPKPKKVPMTRERLNLIIKTFAEGWSAVADIEKRSLLLILGCRIRVNTSGELPLWVELITDELEEPIKAACIPKNRWPMEFC